MQQAFRTVTAEWCQLVGSPAESSSPGEHKALKEIGGCFSEISES